MGAELIDDFIRNILSVPFCPCHFVHTILSNTIFSAYPIVHTILSVPFCPLPFCPRTSLSLTTRSTTADSIAHSTIGLLIPVSWKIQDQPALSKTVWSRFMEFVRYYLHCRSLQNMCLSHGQWTCKLSEQKKQATRSQDRKSV